MLVSPANSVHYTHRSRESGIAGQVTAQPEREGEAAKSGGTSAGLFSNGRFVGASQLTSPATLAALFQLNDDGTVKLGELGSPALKQGARLDTPQQWMSKFLSVGPEETWSASDRAVANNLSRITDSDKEMFRKVTGYNLFISGPAAMIVDDQGNAPPEKDMAAIDELFQRMRYARESGQEVNGDWFKGVSQDLTRMGGAAFPADWGQKADDWFDQLHEAREQNAAAAPSDSAPRSMKPDVDAALGAYNDAGNLATSGSITFVKI